MSEPFGQIIMASLVLLFTAAGGGWALTKKLAGDQAATSFLFVSLVVVIILPVLQSICWSVSRKRLLYQVLYKISFIFSFVWFLSSLLLPLFWMGEISILMRFSVLMFSVCLSMWNVRSGVRHFKAGWKKNGKNIFGRNYDRTSSAINWNKVVRSLKLSTGLIIPGISEKHNAVISVLGLGFMFAGFSLRNAFPVFSIFAWGIPSSILVAYLMYIIGISIGEMLEIYEIEKQEKIKILPIHE